MHEKISDTASLLMDFAKRRGAESLGEDVLEALTLALQLSFMAGMFAELESLMESAQALLKRNQGGATSAPVIKRDEPEAPVA